MRIALIHAVAVAMQPIVEAFGRAWPEAELVNLLEDSLSVDRAREGTLSETMIRRIGTLGDYAHGLGAAGILYTCSAFGPAIDAVARRLPVPVLKPNEAMFDAALATGRRLGMLTTFRPSIASMEEEFAEECARAGVRAELRTIMVEHAMDALKAGDAETHNGLVAAQAGQLADCDAIMLAQFSTSRARPAVEAMVGVPVLTSPDSAVAKLKSLLVGRRVRISRA